MNYMCYRRNFVQCEQGQPGTSYEATEQVAQCGNPRYKAIPGTCIIRLMMNAPKKSPMRWHQLAAIVIAFFAFYMSGLVSRTVFERLPHLEDEIAYLYQARIFAGGQITIDSPDLRSSFWQPFVVDHRPSGQRFGKYTPGWPFVLSFGEQWGQPWIINAFFAMLTVATVYRLGREAFGADVGVIAALLTAFSPAALLLNGTLMAHTAALFYTTFFVYAYWRMERGRSPLRWGLAAGLALGSLAATRPLTTVAIALPFVIWSGARLLAALFPPEPEKSLHADERLRLFWRKLSPLLLLSAGTLLLASWIPLFSYAATGDFSQNLYRLVWEYDGIGYGECCGRSGHTLEKAFRHARFDLSLTAADLFGWQLAPITPTLQEHLQTESGYWPARGFSFVLLPVGFVMGLLMAGERRNLRLLLLLFWSMGALAWVLLPLNLDSSIASLLGLTPDSWREPSFAWFWVIVAVIWLLAPLFVLLSWRRIPQVPYTWLFASIVLGIILVQMLYWIGSQRYSTRYYYEALTAAAMLTALPLAWLVRKAGRAWTYPVLLALLFFTLNHYSTPRIEALYRFNFISPELIEQVDELRTDDRPVLVIVQGATSGEERVRWRSYGSLMAVTSPYLDSDIVVARDFGNQREQLEALFPDRQVLILEAQGNQSAFADQ